jgi:hypothetical protein
MTEAEIKLHATIGRYKRKCADYKAKADMLEVELARIRGDYEKLASFVDRLVPHHSVDSKK